MPRAHRDERVNGRDFDRRTELPVGPGVRPQHRDREAARRRRFTSVLHTRWGRCRAAVFHGCPGFDGAVTKAVSVNEHAGSAPPRFAPLADRYSYGRDLGFMGEPRVNVLEVNLALDRQYLTT